MLSIFPCPFTDNPAFLTPLNFTPPTSHRLWILHNERFVLNLGAYLVPFAYSRVVPYTPLAVTVPTPEQTYAVSPSPIDVPIRFFRGQMSLWPKGESLALFKQRGGSSLATTHHMPMKQHAHLYFPLSSVGYGTRSKEEGRREPCSEVIAGKRDEGSTRCTGEWVIYPRPPRAQQLIQGLCRTSPTALLHCTYSQAIPTRKSLYGQTSRSLKPALDVIYAPFLVWSVSTLYLSITNTIPLYADGDEWSILMLPVLHPGLRRAATRNTLSRRHSRQDYRYRDEGSVHTAHRHYTPCTVN